MKIPNKENSNVKEEKITNYLLSETHPVGKDKFQFFDAFGFSKLDTESFIKALKNHSIERNIETEVESEYGTKYKLKCEINTPDERNPCIVSVWIIEKNSLIPELITAFPS